METTVVGSESDSPEPEKKAASDLIDKLPKAVVFADFLASMPPGESRAVIATAEEPENFVGARIQYPPVFIHCWNRQCAGDRYFDPQTSAHSFEWSADTKEVTGSVTIVYTCRNCRHSWKTYALLLTIKRPRTSMGRWGSSLMVSCTKIGELPAVASHDSPLLLELLSANKDLFQKGRKAEREALGIGAFTYYRRVVEAQKTHLFTEIRRVAEAEGASDEILAAIDSALRTDSFMDAVEQVKDMLPKSLLVEQQNPLWLLHDALSDGVHNLSDAECLERSTVVRHVLAHLAERLDSALKDRKEIKAALGKLTQWRGQRKRDSSTGVQDTRDTADKP